MGLKDGWLDFTSLQGSLVINLDYDCLHIFAHSMMMIIDLFNTFL